VDDVAEAGEAVVPVEGREVMLVVGPVVFCPCVELGCVEFAGTDEVKDEVNKGELPGVELLLGADSVLLGADSTLLGASELPIVEGSTEPETEAEEGEVAPEQNSLKNVAAASASAAEHWFTTHVVTASAIAALLQRQTGSVGEQPELDAAASKHAPAQGGRAACDEVSMTNRERMARAR